MTPAQDTADAERTALTALPGVEQVLSNEGLSAIVGRRVEAVHERVKPGQSIVVSWRAVGTDGTESLTASLDESNHGWLMLTSDADKVRSARRRAEKLGLGDHIRVHPRDGDATVLWGSVWTDPALATPIRRARNVLEQRHPEVRSWAVLRHNPKRRAVVRVGDEVVRIHADRLDAEDGMLATVARWGAAGVPVLALEPVGIKGTAAASPFWGAGDLYAVAVSAADDAARAAEAAGAAIAAVHALPAAGSPLSALTPDAHAAAEAIAEAAPWLDDAVRAAAGRLQPLLRTSCAQDPAVELHGDWSPDQVLAASADGAGEVRIIDVDRAATGPAAADLGSWNAACRREGLPLLAVAHAAGHTRVHAEPDRVTVLAWEAYAHLAAAVDPLRRRHADWAEQVTNRVVHVRACLRELAAARAGEALPHDDGSVASAAPLATGSPVAQGSPGESASSATLAGASAAASPQPEAMLPPAKVEAEGAVWAVDRCWPSGAHGELAVEVSAGGRLRAGLWKDGALELSPAAADPKLKALAPLLAEGGTVVSWRPRKRAVVRSTGPDGDVFTKVVRGGRAQGILDGIARARPFAAALRTPQVLASTDATVGFAALPGRSLHDESAFTDAEWARAWADIADALCAARRGRPATGNGPGALPVHGPEQEAAVLADWFERTAAWTGAQPRFAEAVQKAGETLRGLPVVGNVPTHRDLHDKQLLWDPGLGAGLLDVDTACLGDPALDLGNLRAHALWRERQGVWSAARADLVRRTVDELALAEGLPAPRVGLYEHATLLRLRCVYALRPRYAQAAADLEAELTGRL
ncbi:phosphotransferase [Micrococcus luteus]